MTSATKQFRRWAFTCWRVDDKPVDADSVTAFREIIKESGAKCYVFQLERGEESGKLHFQGRMSWPNAKRGSEAAAACPGADIKFTVEHDEERSSFYAMKVDTRVDGPWSDKDHAYFPPHWKVELRPWQKQLVAMMKVFNDRQIFFIIDPAGNSGKTTVMMNQLYSARAIVIPPHLMTGQDIMRWVQGFAVPGEHHMIYMDLPRAMSKSKKMDWFKLIGAMETIKAGMLFDDRYRANWTGINPPNICVFTNHEPKRMVLTPGRWRTMKIEGDELVDFDPYKKSVKSDRK